MNTNASGEGLKILPLTLKYKLSTLINPLHLARFLNWLLFLHKKYSFSTALSSQRTFILFLLVLKSLLRDKHRNKSDLLKIFDILNILYKQV